MLQTERKIRDYNKSYNYIIFITHILCQNESLPSIIHENTFSGNTFSGNTK